MDKISVLHLVNSLQDSSIIRIVQKIVTISDNKDYSWYIGSLHGLDDTIGLFRDTDVKLLDYSGDSPRAKLSSDLSTFQIKILHTHTPRTIIDGWRAINGLPANSRPIHIATKHLLNRPHDRKWGFFYTVLDYLGLYLPNILVPVSKTMAKQILRMPGLSQHKVFPIPNCISVNSFDLKLDRSSIRDELKIPGDAFVFGFAGRLDQVKRVDILLSALQIIRQQLPNAHLLILGEGKLQTQLEDQARQLGIERSITWAGFRNDVPRMMAAMNIYVQPSDNEGLSLSILEAMAAHKPVISTTVGAADEVLVHGQTGWLIPPGSSKTLAEAMIKSSQDPATFDRISINAYQHVKEFYSVEAMVNSYHSIYRDQVNR